MARSSHDMSSYDALEILISACHEYAVKREMCDMAALEAAKRASSAFHHAAMKRLEEASTQVNIAAERVLMAAAMYEANREDKRNEQQ